MFGSRKRHRSANSQPLTAATANPNAATAAASAFGRRASNQSLSSAAAAAALRARPTTPINVAEVETKRTARRSASVSSRTSLDGRQPLKRSPSSGSMTERTFRSPSPHRSQPSKTPSDAPPVPTIPTNVEPKASPTSKSPTRKRAVSLQTQPLKLASQMEKEGRGSWYGPATVGDPSNVRTADQALSNVDARPGSVSPSINFSYPRGLRVGSPTEMSPAMEAARRSVKGRSSSTASDQDMVFDPNSRRMVPKAELLAKGRKLNHQPSQRAPKKKTASPARGGSHLARGTVGRTRGTAVGSDTSTPTRQRSPQSPHTRQAAEAPELVSSQMYDQMGAEVTVEPKARPKQTQQYSDAGLEVEEAGPSHFGGNARDLSTSQLDSHDASSAGVYEIAEGSAGQKDSVRALDAVPVRSSTYQKSQSPIELPADADRAEGGLATENTLATTDAGQPSDVRMSSRSPQRNAHFASPGERLAVPVRHSPPPRSVSPRKSALKQSTSPNREQSPSETTSESSADVNVPSSAQQEQLVPRKKSVRVSFDDQNTVVVGESASPVDTESPVFHSPQARRPWYNLGRRKKDALSIDDDEELMKPRPALPSFGSVRGKINREPEERQLVRPRETTHGPPHAAGPSMLSPIPSVNDLESEYAGASSDHAIGSLLAEHSPTNETNGSRFAEPLPPEVTSVEGTGYISMSSSTTSSPSSSDSEDEPAEAMDRTALEPEPTTPREQVKEEIVSVAKPPNGNAKAVSDESDSDVFDDASTSTSLPQFEFTHPSPALSARHDQKDSGVQHEAEAEPKREPDPEPRTPHYDVPGGFPDDESDEAGPVAVVEQVQVPPQSTQAPIAEPVTPQRPARSSRAPELSPHEEESESETSAIYSDAYEDLSDMEGDGFLSLDAVVESPVSSKVSNKLFEKALSGSSNEKAVQEEKEAPSPSAPAAQAEPGNTELDWEHAKVFWKNLTAEKRRQLEAEALLEAGTEADLEELRKAKKKSKKKKSTEPKHVEVKKSPAKEKAAHSERTYQVKPGTKVPNEVERQESTMRSTLRSSAPAPRPQQISHRLSQPKPSTSTTGETGRLRKSLRGPQPAPAVTPSPPIRQSMRPDSSSPSASAAAAGGALRKSMRSSPPAPPSVATSDSGVGMRKSLRSNGSTPGPSEQGRSTITKAGRPASFHHGQVGSKESPKSRRRNLSVDEAGGTRSVVSLVNPLRRQGSDSSGSSFVRSKPGRDGPLGLRKSMRSDAPQPSPAQGPDTNKGRFRIRSLSPPSSPFRRTSGGAGAASPPISIGNKMKTTLRSDSSDGSTHRMRLPSFGRNKKKDKKGDRVSSRFGDSSDDDDDGSVAPGFRSRFGDSSDEGEPVPAARPVKGGLSAKTMRKGDSKLAAPETTDSPAPAPTPARKPASHNQIAEEKEESESLLDSSDDEKREEALASSSKSPEPGSPLRRKRSGRGSLTGPASPPALGTQAMGGHAKRSSLMDVLRRKKHQDGGKIQRPGVTESAARKDTKLERSNSTLEALRSNSVSPGRAVRQQSWPLPESRPQNAREDEGDEEGGRGTPDEEKRPGTAAGFGGESSSRPGILHLRSTSHGFFGGAGKAYSTMNDSQPELKKKKKFQTLRRVFRLDD